MNFKERPVIVIGHGVRAAGADPAPLLEMGLPVVTSWQGADLVDSHHPMVFGRPGIYGQRCANKVFYEADQIISIGCRLTPWMIGHGGLRASQELVYVDVDKDEAAKFPDAIWIQQDAKDFIDSLKGERVERTAWLAQCVEWRNRFPWIEAPAHDDTGYINSYRFAAYLGTHLRRASVVVTDVGANMCPVFQAMHLKPPQRLLTSGGLGEMGCALPAAIGASFARNKAHVLCLVGDGGMMMNLQELQTIAFHKLPIKIIVFENDGFGMIKGTHKNLGIPNTGVDRESGASMPDFCRMADAFGIGTSDVRTWNEAIRWIPWLFECDGPYLMQVHIDPDQDYVPRLKPIIRDGAIISARFDQLSPLL